MYFTKNWTSILKIALACVFVAMISFSFVACASSSSAVGASTSTKGFKIKSGVGSAGSTTAAVSTAFTDVTGNKTIYTFTNTYTIEQSDASLTQYDVTLSIRVCKDSDGNALANWNKFSGKIKRYGKSSTGTPLVTEPTTSLSADAKKQTINNLSSPTEFSVLVESTDGEYAKIIWKFNKPTPKTVS